MKKSIKNWLYAATMIAATVSFPSCDDENEDQPQEVKSSLLNPNEVKGKMFYKEDHNSKFIIRFDSLGNETYVHKSTYFCASKESTPKFGEEFISGENYAFFYEKSADGAHLYDIYPIATIEMDLPASDGNFIDPKELVGKTFLMKYNSSDYETTWTIQDGYAKSTLSDNKYIINGLNFIIDHETTYYTYYRFYKNKNGIDVCQVIDYGTAVEFDFDAKFKELREEASKEYAEADPKPVF